MTTASIVTYNHTLSDIKPTLDSLVGSDVVRIYIVDHSDNYMNLRNELAAYATTANVTHGRLLYVRHKNLGYGSGHNVAIRAALRLGTNYHAVVNPDVWFDPSVSSELYAFMEANPEIGLSMPNVLYPDGSTQHLCKLLPAPSDMFLRLCFPFLWKKGNERYELRHSGYDRIMNVPFLSGCFMFLRADALRKVGLFDETFFMYAEDIDLSRRIHEQYKTMFFPSANIYHKFSRASRHSMRLFCIHVSNIAHYFNKWGWFNDPQREEINKATLSQFQ